MKRLTITFCLLALALAGCGRSGPEPIDRTNTIVRGVNFVGVSVSSLQDSTAFYSKAVKLQGVKDGTLTNSPAISNLAGREHIHANTRLMQSVNAQLLVMQFDNRSEAAQAAPAIQVQGPGIAHVCYQVAKSTDAYGTFLQLGATPIGARDMVQLNPRNPVEYAYATDDDGIMFEVEHVDIAALNLPAPPKNDYRIRHVSISTPDIDRAVDFYSVLLEEESPRRAGNWFAFGNEKTDQVSGLADSKIKMAWFQLRNLELELIQYASHPTQLPAEPRPVDALGYNMIVLDVTDVEIAKNMLLAAGGTVVSEPESMHGGEILFGRDPDGNLLGLQVVATDAIVSSQKFDGDGT